MSLVGDVFAYLGKRGVECALIGGEALAVHGIARATLDSDLLTTEPGVLSDAFWSNLLPRGAVDIRAGDADDPLAGAVRIRRRNEQTDVIVGRPWARPMLRRARQLRVGDEELAVVDRADLVLLKLFAAGPQDLLDARLLLQAGGEDLTKQLERRLKHMPAEVGRVWRRVRRRR